MPIQAPKQEANDMLKRVSEKRLKGIRDTSMKPNVTTWQGLNMNIIVCVPILKYI